jgi:hypothetical protein
MKRGVIGVPDSSGWIATVEGVETTRQDELGNDRTAALSVTEQRDLMGGTTYYSGEAFRERTVENEGYEYRDGVIKTTRNLQETVDHTRYVLVPRVEDAHAGYMVVSSSSGVFAFATVSRQNPGRVQAARIRTGDFLRDRRDEVDVKTAGGTTGSPHAGKVTAWGDDVLADPDMDDLLGRQVHGDLLNQVAVRYIWDNIPHYVYLARSGYVEIYKPTDTTTEQFLNYVRREIIPYTDAAETDGEQSSLDEADEGDE